MLLEIFKWLFELRKAELTKCATKTVFWSFKMSPEVLKIVLSCWEALKLDQCLLNCLPSLKNIAIDFFSAKNEKLSSDPIKCHQKLTIFLVTQMHQTDQRLFNCLLNLKIIRTDSQTVLAAQRHQNSIISSKTVLESLKMRKSFQNTFEY